MAELKYTHDDLMDAVRIEEKRRQLAGAKDLEGLRQLYKAELPVIPPMNSPLKWDFYSGRDFDAVDDITQARVEAVCSHLKTGHSVLDYGCGYAFILKEISKQGLDISYTGIDFSAGFVKKLAGRYPPDKHPKINFVCESTEGFQMPKGPFDAVLLLEVVEHIPPADVVSFLKKWKEFLKPNGTLIVSVPLFENLEFTTAPCYHCGAINNPNGHIRSYSRELIEAEGILAGYELISSIPIYPTWPKLFAMKQFIKETFLGAQPVKPSNCVSAFSNKG